MLSYNIKRGLGNDGITYAIRLAMQARFGDAGHGFHLLSRYDNSYRHRAVVFEDNGDWGQCPMMRRCKKDGRYGYGGVTTYSVAGGKADKVPEKTGSGA